MTVTKKISDKDKEDLFQILQKRFDTHMERHPEVDWQDIAYKLLELPNKKLAALMAMEESGGEPDIVSGLPDSKPLVFVDCSPESPKGRRSLCYDEQALISRKQHKPKDSAVHLSESIGIQILSEKQYAHLQQSGSYDNKTSSWLSTPPAIRELGGAIFGDRRFGRVFTYHNGAESYYGSRGFRAALEL